MTQMAGPDLNKGGGAAALTRPARQVHLAVLAAFAQTGKAPGRGELERIARASGADIYDRIPAARLDEVCRAFLDRLTVDGMRMRMSDEFGRQLRARLPAPKKNGSKKSNKPKFKTMQMTKTVDASGKTIYAHARGNGSRSAAEKRISRR